MQYKIQIIPVPAFKDNYIWLMHNGIDAVAVDPGDAAPLLSTLSTLNLNLEAILITHHHQDHIGGVDALLKQFPALNVYAPKLENYHFKHTAVGEPDTFKCTEWLPEFKVLDLPGHTLGHIGLYMEHVDQNWLFCGDTLFGAGCGRLFEGTPLQMFTSLQKLATLPADTQVFCTHEYTLHNINFALSIEPDNKTLLQRHQDTIAMRNAGLPSLPSTIALELATNPFLRCDSKQIQLSTQLLNQPLLKVFTKIRELRNSY
jgi:hydroxyacylglutathione hydrolase